MTPRYRIRKPRWLGAPRGAGRAATSGGAGPALPRPRSARSAGGAPETIGLNAAQHVHVEVRDAASGTVDVIRRRPTRARCAIHVTSRDNTAERAHHERANEPQACPVDRILVVEPGDAWRMHAPDGSHQRGRRHRIRAGSPNTARRERWRWWRWRWRWYVMPRLYPGVDPIPWLVNRHSVVRLRTKTMLDWSAMWCPLKHEGMKARAKVGEGAP